MITRLRRLRKNKVIRVLVSETSVRVQNLVFPIFVVDGDKRKEEILSMPGIFKLSPRLVISECEKYLKLGLRNFILFGTPCINDKKDNIGTISYSQNSLIAKSVSDLKKEFGNDIVVACDVCLCAYTEHGHCGPIKDGVVDNDEALIHLSKQALLCAESGADIVAPSDMMDGRVSAIRNLLDNNGFNDTIIMSYSTKYASSYYGPFRDAQSSSPNKNVTDELTHRKTYQMDFRNANEAIRESLLDINEGADILMVKPALAYLDIINLVKRNCNLPLAAYNVSGEYSMVKFYCQNGLANEADLVIENLTAIKRAGADMIITYHAADCVEQSWLK